MVARTNGSLVRYQVPFRTLRPPVQSISISFTEPAQKIASGMTPRVRRLLGAVTLTLFSERMRVLVRRPYDIMRSCSHNTAVLSAMAMSGNPGMSPGCSLTTAGRAVQG